MNTHLRGRGFEDLAASHLVRHGYRIEARNVRFGREEIDLVVRRGATVAFVEVKGRTHDDRGHPFSAIDHRKRAAIARVARDWIRRHGRPGDLYRFDAVAVIRAPGRPPGRTPGRPPGRTSEKCRVEHIADAWRLG